MRISLTPFARSLTLISLAFIAASLCSASEITYYVDQTVGDGDVTGFIETDGTIGTLGGGFC